VPKKNSKQTTQRLLFLFNTTMLENSGTSQTSLESGFLTARGNLYNSTTHCMGTSVLKMRACLSLLLQKPLPPLTSLLLKLTTVF